MLNLLRSAFVCVTLFVASGAQAAVITSLYGTGLDATGAPQVAGGLDAHYVVVENGNQSAVVVSNPASTYFANNAQSQWIWQAGNGLPINVTRTFRTTFDLTGFDETSAIINGAWGTDNQGLDILINGVSTGINLLGVVVGNFSQLHSYTISSGFVAGVNTLDFVIQDNGVIAAFRTELTGTANAVPEPGTLAIVVLGLLAAGAIRTRKVA